MQKITPFPGFDTQGSVLKMKKIDIAALKAAAEATS